MVSVRKQNNNFNIIFIITSFIMTALLGFICIYSYSKSVKAENSDIGLTTILMVAASSLFIGHLIGFLYGIPRTVQEKSDKYEFRADFRLVNENFNRHRSCRIKII